MKKPGLLEFTIPDYKILEDTVVDEKTGDRVLRVEVVWQKADIINNNKRRYRRSLLEREIKRLHDPISRGEVMGSAYHPKDGIGEATDVSHIWEEASMLEDGTCVGVVKVLPTSKGKDVQEILRHGGKLGMSSRGFGTTTEKQEKVDGKVVKFYEVNDDYQLKSPGDFVMSPSVPGAGTRKILESQLTEAADSDANGEEKDMSKELEQKITDLESKLAEKDSAIEEYEAKLAEKDEKIKELEKKIAEMEEKLKELVDAENESIKSRDDIVKEFVAAYSEQPGFLPEDDGAGDDEDAEASKDERIKELEAKVAEYEKKEKERKEAEERAKAEEKLQAELKAKLDEVLAKEEYEIFRDLIRKKVVAEDGKVNIDKVEKVEEVVKAIYDELSELAVEAEKAKILSSGTSEKGKIQNPEGGKEKKLTEKAIRGLYKEAVASGFKGSFEKYKKAILSD